MTTDGAKIVIRLSAEEKRRYEELSTAKGSRSAAARLAAYLRAELLIAEGMLKNPPPSQS